MALSYAILASLLFIHTLVAGPLLCPQFCLASQGFPHLHSYTVHRREELPMSSIHKQVMTDDHGQPVSVVIPYHEWLEIERVLESQLRGTESVRLRAYAGVIHLSKDPVAYQRQLRDEWT